MFLALYCLRRRIHLSSIISFFTCGEAACSAWESMLLIVLLLSFLRRIINFGSAYRLRISCRCRLFAAAVIRFEQLIELQQIAVEC